MSTLPCPGPTRLQTEDVLTELVTRLTGLPEDLVRPRDQPKPPKVPPLNVSWCAVGILRRGTPGASPVQRVRQPDGTVTAQVDTHEALEVLVSFYGPRAGELATALREGLQLEENRYPLRLANISFVQSGDIVSAREFANMRWVYREDMPLTFRRGPAHQERGKPQEGTVTINTIESVPLCGGCQTSR